MTHATLLHSVSYSGSWGQQLLPLEEFVDKAAELGFDGVMLMAKRPHLSVLDWDTTRLSDLRGRLEKHRLRMGCIAGYTNFTADLEHGEIPHREFQIRHVTDLARMARALGGTLVRVFTAYESQSATPQTQWNMTGDIACGFESLHDLIHEIDEPNCRAIFDAWAPALHGADLAAAAAKMAACTVHTTIANYQIRPRYRYIPKLVNYEKLTPTVQAVPIDEGFIDYQTFLTAMGAGGYSGAVAYEMCSPLLGGGSIENLDRYARKFLEFMK
jgi:sugar phosphate isomerase/epimerase